MHKAIARLLIIMFVSVLGFAASTTSVRADSEPDDITITYVVSEEPLPDLEATIVAPDPYTGPSGTVVHHIPTLSSAVYSFLGWYHYVEGEQVTLEKYDVIEEDITVYGKWQLTPRVVTYDLDGGTNHPDNPYVVYANQDYILGDATRYGYDFAGWELDGTPVEAIEDATTSLTLTATWTAVVVPLTLQFDNGEDDQTLDFAFDQAYDLDAPERIGYDFAGWTYEGDSFASSGTVDFAEARTVVATWTPATDTPYTVDTYTEALDGSYVKTSESFTGTTLEDVTLTPEAPEGFELDDAQSVLSGTISADGSLVLEVYFDRLVHTVEFLDENDQLIDTRTVKHGGEADAPDYVKTGYQVSWNTAEFTNVTADVQTKVILTANTYTVSFDSETGETFDAITVTFDQPVGTLPTPDQAPENKVFQNWSYEGVAYDANTVYAIDGDLTLSAVFVAPEDVQYTVQYRFEDESGTFVVDDARTLTLAGTAGDQVTAPVLDEVPAGFELSGTLPEGIISLDGLVLVVDYARIVHTVTFNYVDNDVPGSSDVLVKHGLDAVAPDADGKSHYTFAGWDEDITGVTASFETDALYEAIAYTISYELNDALSNDPATLIGDTTSYTVEDSFALASPSRETFVFQGWYLESDFSGEPVDAIEEGTSGDITLYAGWSPVTFTVTFAYDGTTSDVEVEIYETVDVSDFPDVTVPEDEILIGWYYLDGGVEYAFTSETLVVSDLDDVYPVFAQAVTVTFVDQNAQTIQSDLVAIGQAIDAPALPVEDGYDIAWDQNVPAVASADLTITAVATPVVYDITYLGLEGASNANPATYTIESSLISLVDPGTRDGYAFIGWFDAAEDGNEVVEVPAGSTGDLTLHAIWEEEQTGTTLTETLTNFSEGGSYQSGSFEGDNGITWDYNEARGDLSITSGNKALTFAKDPAAFLEATIPGGIASLTITYEQAYGADAGVRLSINGEHIGDSPLSGEAVRTHTFQDINVEGAFTIRIQTTDGQLTIDDITWTSYGASTGMYPSIDGLTDASITEGDTFDPLDGVTASDAEDGDLTSSIDYQVLDSSDNVLSEPVGFDTLVVGTYTIEYSVTDSDDNTVSDSVTLTVIEEGTIETLVLFEDLTLDSSAPEGWTFSGTGTYANDAIKMDETGDSITTETFTLQASATVTIEIVGYSLGGDGGTLTFEDQNGDVIHTESGLLENGNSLFTFSITDLDVTSFTMTYTKTKGNVGIYSITIEHDPQ
jgi:uncharacterized repeat protein (TIGR02543 family)